MKFSTVLAAVAVIAAAGCGGGSDYGGVTGTTNGGTTTGGTTNGGSTTPVSTNAVTIGDDFFSPNNIQVAIGTTVTWTWPSGVNTHNVTFGDGQASGDKNAGASYSRTFSTAGTFNYNCTLHGGMNGTVHVQ